VADVSNLCACPTRFPSFAASRRPRSSRFIARWWRVRRQQGGLGYAIWQAKAQFDLAAVYACIVLRCSRHRAAAVMVALELASPLLGRRRIARADGGLKPVRIPRLFANGILIANCSRP